MRGWIIVPFLAEFFRLDRAGTVYDPDLREPKRVATADRLGKSGRQELAPILVAVEVKPVSYQRLDMVQQGDRSVSAFDVLAHFENLEAEGLVDANGTPAISIGDRLARILTMAEEVETTFPNPPGMYVHEVKPMGYGLGGRKNLLMIGCSSRKPG